jgi:aldehyde dehydrogenase
LERIAAIKQGDPLDRETMMGPQVSVAQLEKIESYVKIGREEGAELLIGGSRPEVGEQLSGGYYFEPTVLKGHNKMRVFQEEIFGPVLAVTTFRDEAEALEIANDTLYGLGAGVWSRDGSRAFRMGRGIQAGRVWTNCYHLYPAHAAFGGYKESCFGREGGLHGFDFEEVELKRVLVEQSNVVAATVTSDKLETTAPFQIASFDDVDHLVVENDVDPQLIKTLKRMGLSVHQNVAN